MKRNPNPIHQTMEIAAEATAVEATTPAAPAAPAVQAIPEAAVPLTRTAAVPLLPHRRSTR